MEADFGTWLRARRQALGLSQARLAERAGVHQPTVAAI
jgi:transcriptional regulator with XRE-family HTH domain